MRELFILSLHEFTCDFSHHVPQKRIRNLFDTHFVCLDNDCILTSRAVTSAKGAASRRAAGNHSAGERCKFSADSAADGRAGATYRL